MSSRKKVFLTVNPGLIQGKRYSTVRALATNLDEHSDLLVVPIDSYDFERGTVVAYRRLRGGKFSKAKTIKPEADLWVVYTDGYYLDCRRLGFSRRRDFFNAQVEFHTEQMRQGSVSTIINAPQAEARTLKSWFAGLDSKDLSIIETYLVSKPDQVQELYHRQGPIVAKPEWGGGGTGVYKIEDEKSLRKFMRQQERASDTDMSDYCFQPYAPGDEKRLWFVDGQCVAGRIWKNRATPWSRSSRETQVSVYDESDPGFYSDLKAAQKLFELSGLSFGSVDFLGTQINELNGAGTIFTEYRNWDLIVDARPKLIDFVLAKALS